ncbi:hypothetical protein JVU11DRAFT_9172 [Chiua virens]|nr:hypothetical protein JVU11DRAFT_9172 [Chiua virens]
MDITRAQEIWGNAVKNAEPNPPPLMRCGGYDNALEAFPVVEQEEHHIWIPRQCKFALRLLNHTIYCLWCASIDKRFPHGIRHFLMALVNYTVELRARFFREVISYWYTHGTPTPTPEMPIRRSQPFHSYYLRTFLICLYNKDTPVPPRDVREIESNKWKLDPTKFDWTLWSQKKAPNKILFGSLPPEYTQEHKLLLEENRRARIPHAPSVELESDSWFEYSCALYQEFVEHEQWRSVPSATSAENSHHNEGARGDGNPRKQDEKRACDLYAGWKKRIAAQREIWL